MYLSGILLADADSIDIFFKTFELLTGRWLFEPVEGERRTREDDHLAKMMELTGERFSDSCLARAHKREQYFDVCLLSELSLLSILVSTAMCRQSAQGRPHRWSEYRELYADPGQCAGRTYRTCRRFIRACLRLDYYGRPSAKESQVHPWLFNSNCNYYC